MALKGSAFFKGAGAGSAASRQMVPAATAIAGSAKGEKAAPDGVAEEVEL